MKNFNLRAQAACLLPVLALAASCGSAPKRIDPFSDESVTTMGVDYKEIVEWSETLTMRMLDSGFLRSEEFGPKPVKMVVSDIENKTDLSQFPTEMVIGRIRTNLLGSGLVRSPRVLSSTSRNLGHLRPSSASRWTSPPSTRRCST